MASPAVLAAAETVAYYHGLLPREDIAALLTKNGDFILRLSEDDKKPGKPVRLLILSMFISPTPQGCKQDTATGTFKHYIVKEERGMVTIDGELCKKSAGAVIDAHLNNEIRVNRNLPESILRTAIVRQKWELLHENITKEKKLGEGAFGEVCKGKLKIPKKGIEVDVAIKVAKATEMNKEKIKEVMKEARIMRNFDHPNVVKLYGVAVIKEPLMIVMELVTGGALDDYLKKNKVSMEHKTRMVLGAAWGVAYMHSKNFIHRDLAARNCLFNNGVCKISDFGLTREGEEYKMKVVTKLPIRWLAPEIIEQFTYSKATDVWAFGVLVWEIYHDAKEPYDGMTFGEVKKEVPKGHRMSFDDRVDHTIVKIVNDCWQHNPDKRRKMYEIVNALENHTEIRFQGEQDEDNDAPAENRKEKPAEVEAETIPDGDRAPDKLDMKNGLTPALLEKLKNATAGPAGNNKSSKTEKKKKSKKEREK